MVLVSLTDIAMKLGMVKTTGTTGTVECSESAICVDLLTISKD